MTSSIKRTITLCGLFFFAVSANASDIAPPALGEETKGIPAVIESNNTSTSVDTGANSNTAKQASQQYDSKEFKGKNGQTYRLELKHPNMPNQYIDKTALEDNIESTDNDIENTPNLPKWKLGSW